MGHVDSCRQLTRLLPTVQLAPFEPSVRLTGRCRWRCAARNLTIVGLEHDRAGWFNKDQLALIQGVGAIQIDPLLCLTELDM